MSCVAEAVGGDTASKDRQNYLAAAKSTWVGRLGKEATKTKHRQNCQAREISQVAITQGEITQATASCAHGGSSKNDRRAKCEIMLVVRFMAQDGKQTKGWERWRQQWRRA